MYHRKKYPWIAYKNPSKPGEGRIDYLSAAGRMIKNFINGKISGWLGHLITPEKEPKTLSGLINYTIGTSLSKKSQGYAEANELEVNKSFPKVSALLDFLDGSSTIQAVYTAEFQGKQVPIYLSSKKEQEPSDEELKAAIEHVKKEKRSPYQDGSYKALSPFYRKDFNSPGLDVLFNEDTGRDSYIQDPSFAVDWVIRDEIGDIARAGIEDGKYSKVAYGAKIRKFFRPSKATIFAGWSVRDLAYDFFDYLVYAPLKAGAYAISGSSPWTQRLVKDNYKAATLLSRGVLPSGVSFDLRSEGEKEKTALRRAA